jgi:hypothetical protein
MVDGEARLTVLIGTWLMFGHVIFFPVFLLGWGISFLHGFNFDQSGFRLDAGVLIPVGPAPHETDSHWLWLIPKALAMAYSLLLFTLEAIILFKTTRHWLRTRRMSANERG